MINQSHQGRKQQSQKQGQGESDQSVADRINQYDRQREQEHGPGDLKRTLIET